MESRPEKQIQQLFDDWQLFSKIAAPIEIDEFTTKRFDYFKYPLGIELLCIKKDKIKTVQQAFVILFVIDLHIGNEWDKNKGLDVKLDLEEWEKAILDIWIECYFNLSYCKVGIQSADRETFLKKFLWWMPENMTEDEKEELTNEIDRVKWVCSIYRNSFNQKYFGETEDYYFFAESGVYD